ncbi:DUF6625 family protein [Clostridium perfringens]|uniref:DUF6625 family protein n=1 Tax=Clostridium perfringens TaxID=1502 RepID=UPI001C88499E|nr:DUF6625 family protein [Clostridium perfringens]
MYNIAILNVYIGKLPNSFPLWLKSCENNETIQFIVLTDDNYYGVIPENVIIKNITLKEIKIRIESKLGFEVSLESPYKLCDFKPTYGLIFDDILSKYDFWGYCDLDMLFGDLRKFINNDLLLKYDKLFTKGHLTLYRNNEKVNNSFKLKGSIANYKKVFTTSLHYGFDEINGMEIIWDNNNLKQFKNANIADILLKSFNFKIRGDNYKKQIFIWNKGKIYRVINNEIREEYMYIHYQKRECLINDNLSENFDELDNIIISPKGFFSEMSFKKTYKVKLCDHIYFYFIKIKNIPKRIKMKIVREKVYGKLKK